MTPLNCKFCDLVVEATTVRREDIPSFGVIGLMASGKSTHRDRLVERIEAEFGVPVYKGSFSDKISEIARDLFGMAGKDRRLLQQIGAKMNEIDPAVWAKYLVRNIKANGRTPFVIDGIRRAEEAEAFRQGFPSGFLIILIRAEEHDRLEAYSRAYHRYPSAGERGDITEKMVSGITPDITLDNGYTQESLDANVNGIIDAIRDGSIRAKYLRHGK